MDSEMYYHLVDFAKWCPQCKYKDCGEDEDPCWDCLDEGYAEYGRPVEFKEDK